MLKYNNLMMLMLTMMRIMITMMTMIYDDVPDPDDNHDYSLII